MFKRKLLIILVVFLATLKLSATHLMGAQLYFRHVVGDSFDIIANLYRDCNGIPMPDQSLRIKSENGNEYTISAVKTKLYSLDLCRTIKTRCDSIPSPFPYGIEKYTFTSRVDFSKYKGCKFIITWEQCCRSASIKTGAASQNFHVEALLNKCYKNNSAQFLYDPEFTLAATRKHQSFSFFATDADRDSLSYSLNSAEQVAGTPITYTYPYSYKKPFEFKGFPNTTYIDSNGSGLYFDSTTGAIKFTPEKVQITVIGVRVNEWRKDSSGKYINIGYINSDLEYIFYKDSINTIQKISGVNGTAQDIIKVKYGTKIMFDVYSIDKDSNDVIKLNWSGNINGATFITDTSKKQKGTFQWTPKQSDVSSRPYVFYVSSADMGCPVSRTLKQFTIYVSNVTGIADDIYENPNVSIYPNPSSDIINIISKKDFKNMYIIDITGRLIY